MFSLKKNAPRRPPPGPETSPARFTGEVRNSYSNLLLINDRFLAARADCSLLNLAHLKQPQVGKPSSHALKLIFWDSEVAKATNDT